MRLPVTDIAVINLDMILPVGIVGENFEADIAVLCDYSAHSV